MSLVIIYKYINLPEQPSFLSREVKSRSASMDTLVTLAYTPANLIRGKVYTIVLKFLTDLELIKCLTQIKYPRSPR